MDPMMMVLLLAILICTPAGPLLAALVLAAVLGVIGYFGKRAYALSVTRGASAAPAGVPFYIKKGRLIQETSYLETLATLTLSATRITLNDQQEPAQTEIIATLAKTVTLNAANTEQVAAIRQRLGRLQATAGREQQLAAWQAIRELFEALPDYQGEIPTGGLPLMGNVVKPGSYVDYDETYYLNQHRPLIGSAEMNIELAADGTLSKAAAKSEDTTLTSILAHLPALKTKETPTDAAAPQSAEDIAKGVLMAGRGADTVRYEVSLEAEHLYLEHVFSREVTQRGFQAAIAMDPSQNWYRREIRAALSQPPAEQPPAEQPSAPTPKPGG